MATWIVLTGLIGRLVLAVLIVLSIWSFAVIIRKARILSALQSQQNIPLLKKSLDQRDWKSLSELVQKQDSISAEMLHNLMSSPSQKTESLERLVNGYLIEKRTELESGLTVLATLGSNAPFIGLFGTVLGIIQAFGVLGQKQTAGASVMTGISEALLATAVGLFVAIPAVVSYNVFSRKVRIILSECEYLKEIYFSSLGAGK